MRVKRYFSDMQGLNKFISYEPFLWKLPAQGHKPRRRKNKRSSKLHPIQTRKGISQDDNTVSLESKQPRLKQVKKLTEESEADFLISSEC